MDRVQIPSTSVKTNFLIGSTGKVVNSNIISSTLNNKSMESCLLGVLNRIEFPALAAGGVIEVDYPFSFSPVPDVGGCR